MSSHANAPSAHLALPRWAWLLVPLMAFLAIAPMLRHGISCGHDIAFHGSNWFEATHQWRQGVLYPRWAESPNYNAGAPRFIFYPPLSWMLGGAIGQLTGWQAAPFVYIFVVLCAAGAAMYRLARLALWPVYAMAAALLYMANPYTMFVAYTRSAYSELLAAAILPLLMLAVLRPRVHIAMLAEVVAVLWLTNAPAAVLGMYTLALLGVLAAWRHRSIPNLLRTAAGTALGLAVAAVYILPAAYERKWVQISDLTEGDYDFHRSFLFGRLGESMHVIVLHRVSKIAVIMLAVIAVSTVVVLLQRRHWHVLQKRVFFQLAILAAIILLLLLPASALVWKYAPELAFLQFPWRWLTALAPIFALLLAAAMGRLPRLVALGSATLLAACLVIGAHHHFAEACDPEDLPKIFFAELEAGIGHDAAGDYTPVSADIDDLMPDTRHVWFYPANEIGDTKPSHHNDTAIDIQPQVQRWSAEHKEFSVDLPQPSVAILQLLDYPAWRIHLNGHPAQKAVPASSGQIQILLPAGHSEIDLRFVHTLDRIAANIISVLGLLLLAWVSWRERHHHRPLRNKA